MKKLNIQNRKIKLSTLYSLPACPDVKSGRAGLLSTDNKGMTLLEIAISMAIMSIALVALANLFPIGLKASRRAADFSAASILAQRVIENIKLAASIYDGNDKGDVTSTIPANISDDNDIGYFELTNPAVPGAPYNFPFYDVNDLKTFDESQDISIDPATGYTTYTYRYKDTDMRVYVKSVDWDANGNGKIGLMDGDFDDVLLSQKVYVAVYWTEADKERADTFIAYISNPFYERYR